MTRSNVLIGALVLLAQLGGSRGGAHPMTRSLTQPMPQAPTSSPMQSPNVWVPDRVTPDPVNGGASITPGHWDRPSPSGGFYAPPLTSCNSVRGQCSSSPAGDFPSPEMGTAP
jgi:hypothetical protein